MSDVTSTYFCEVCTGADIPENVVSQIVCVPLPANKQPWCSKKARVLQNKFIMTEYDGHAGAFYDNYYLLDKTKMFEVRQWCSPHLMHRIVLVDVYCESCVIPAVTKEEPDIFKLLRDMEATLKLLTQRVERLESKKKS